MHDVIGTYERLRRVYRLYVESAFPLRSEALTAERDELLARRGTPADPGTLAQPPVLETVPVYNRTSLTLQQLSQQLVTQHVQDIPVGMTHALLHQAGCVVAAGPIDEVLVSGRLSACFGLPLELERRAGRYTVRARLTSVT